MINSAIYLVIDIMTSFLDGPLVVILILGFLLYSPLFFTFNIFPTLSTNKEENTFLTCKTSSMLCEMLDFEAFLIVESIFLLGGEGATSVLQKTER